MKILLIAASARRDSANKQLANTIRMVLAARPGVVVDMPDFKLFTMPVYDGDIEAEVGVPDGARALADRWAAADGVVLCTPEYNGGIPGSLKNAIDWISRLRPHPIADKWLLLTGASPGALGSVRGLWHTRVPFEALGAMVYPEMFGLAGAQGAFTADGELKDAARSEQLKRLLERYASRIAA